MANDRRVGNLFVQMRAEIGGLKTDIKELDNAFKQGFAGIEKSAASAFVNVGKSIAGAFSVAAIIGFTKSIVELGGHLKDLEEQTGISGQLLSGMKSTLEESGTSLDAFAKGIFTAQKNLGQIGSDTDKAAIAIKQLGLNLVELRNASPEQFLELISEALAKIDNPVQRAAAGAAILGRQYQELGPAISQLAGKFGELRAKGITQADIALLDEAGDAWTRLMNKITIAAATIFTDTIRTIDVIKQLINLNFQGLTKGAGAGALIGAIEDRPGSAGLQGAFEGALKPKPTAAITPFQVPTAKPETAKAIKETRIELAHLRDGFSDLEESAFKASQAMIPVFKELQNLGLTQFERDLATINDRFDAMAVTIQQFGEATRQDIKPFIEQLEFLRSQELLKLEPDADLWDLPEKMVEEAKKSKTAWDELFSGVGSGLQSTLNGLIQGTATWGETWRAMLANIATSAAHALGSSLIKGLADTGAGDSGWLGGLLKTAGSALSAFFGGTPAAAEIATAGGGIFRAPTLRMIGEAGPEAVVPLPRMRELAGGKPNVNVTVNGSIIPNPGVTRDQVIQIGIDQFTNRRAWTQAYENRRSRE